MTLTPKQEKFCQVYLETGNASEAYRQSYNAENMADTTINTKAHELLRNGKITVRLEQLQSKHLKRHNITVDDLLAELEENRKLAIINDQAAAANGSTMGKAKLLGLDVSKVDITTKGEKINTGRNLDDFYNDVSTKPEP